MKKALPFLLIIGALAFGCSKSDSTSITLVDPNEAKLSATAVQKAYIADFTATWCGPCGAYGQPQLNSIASTYPNEVVAMAVHASASNDPFYSKIAGDMATAINLTGFPTISLGLKSNIYGQNASSYGSLISAITSTAPRVGINVVHSMDNATGKLVIKARMKSLSDLSSEKFGVALYVMEDGVVSYQNGTPEGNNFIHNELMRSNPGSIWGTAVSSDKLAANSTSDFTSSVILSPSWESTNLYAVAVVYKLDATGKFTSVENVNTSKIVQ
jgi:thiol-disulfide isomerase/thioredoxin